MNVIRIPTGDDDDIKTFRAMRWEPQSAGNSEKLGDEAW